MAAKQKVLVTGATGFIAKHVVLELLARGYSVRGTVRALGRGEEVRGAVGAHLEGAGVDLQTDLEFAKADLTSDDGWDEVVAGCGAVLHTASPFPMEMPKDEDDLIRPAVEGTRRVLEASARAGVARVIVTSSAAAIMYGRADSATNYRYGPSDWTNLASDNLNPYVRSKTLAEKEAWRLAEQLGLELTTINPVLVLGPALDEHFGTSLGVVQRVMGGGMPVLPRLMMPLVDVRDIAALHVNALKDPASAGQRFLASSAETWVRDLAKMLKSQNPQLRISTLGAPDWLIRIAAIFDGAIRLVVGELGERRDLDRSAAVALLGRPFVTPEDTLKAAAQTLFEHGAVKKPS
jgi:nucleoside-diphosphate-sugar epimerase